MKRIFKIKSRTEDALLGYIIFTEDTRYPFELQYFDKAMNKAVEQFATLKSLLTFVAPEENVDLIWCNESEMVWTMFEEK